jgi:hypothetical protein
MVLNRLRLFLLTALGDVAVAVGVVPYVIKTYNPRLGVFILVVDCVAFLSIGYIVTRQK